MNYNECIKKLEEALQKNFFDCYVELDDKSKQRKILLAKSFNNDYTKAEFNFCFTTEDLRKGPSIIREKCKFVEVYDLGTVKSAYEFPGQVKDIVNCAMFGEYNEEREPLFKGTYEDYIKEEF